LKTMPTTQEPPFVPGPVASESTIIQH